MITPSHHALNIDKDICIGCTLCMKVCPTEALRVKEGKAILQQEKCIDCGECYRVCPVNAISIEQDDFQEIFKYPVRIALIPSVFIAQFPRDYAVNEIFDALKEIGFTDAYNVDNSAVVLKEILQEYISNKDNKKPVISSFCPAVVRLIQVRFPSLVENIMNVKAPSEIATDYLRAKLEAKGINPKDIGIFYVTPCIAKINKIKTNSQIIDGVINLDFIYNKVYAILRANANRKITTDKDTVSKEGYRWSLTGGENDNANGRSLAVDEINNVIKFLERVENDDIGHLDFLEMRACAESCSGGILASTNRFLAVERLKDRAGKAPGNNSDRELIQFKKFLKENIHTKKIIPQSIISLDSNISIAMEKMKKIQEIVIQLPKVDCGLCGTPSCRTLAEDIAQGKGEIEQCLFVQSKKEGNEAMLSSVKKIWGNK